jgi:intracellular multiplication protein IcmP
MSGSFRTRQNSIEEAGLSIIFLIILIGGMAFFGWMKAHGTVSLVVLSILRAELWPASLWTHSVDQARQAMAHAQPASVTIHQLVRASAFVGRIYRIPLALLLAIAGVIALFRAPGERFSKVLDFDALMAIQAQNFPSIAAFLKRRHGLILPAEGKVRPGDFALHLGEWIGIHALTPKDLHNRTANATGPSAFQFDRIAGHGALVAQLGPAWHGLDGAAPQVRAMVAVFALHVAREREAARDLLGTLSQSIAELSPTETTDDPATNPGPLSPLAFSDDAMAAVDAVLIRAEITQPALAVMGFYAFTHTALMGLLMHARARAGVLAPAQFAFLKLVDRPLWYALHSLGFPLTEEDYGPQPNARIEALGARAHWEAERTLRKPLSRPHVEAALDAINSRILDPSNRGRLITEIR